MPPSILIGTMLALLVMSVPVAVALGLTGAAFVAGDTRLSLLVVPQQILIGLDKYPLAAIPFFILAGNLMETGGISSRLVDLAKSIVGGFTGGLALTCVLTCMIFAAVSGSSIATVFAIGSILIPAMVRHGYPAPFAAALMAVTAELGVIIPPSIPMILLGVSAELSIGELFIAGVGPGLLIGFALMLVTWFICKRNGYGQNDGHDRLSVGQATRRAAAALGLPVIILGGIYSGAFTPTEASAVAVVYALLVGTLVYRELGMREIYVAFRRSSISAAAILLLVATAAFLSYLINRAGLPAQLGAWLNNSFDSPAGYLLSVNVALFIVGMFIETGAAILVLGPLLTPVAVNFGIDPIHFGIVIIVNLALGMVTPPFGVNLFAACQVANVSVLQIVRYLLPFVLTVLICLLIISYVPVVSLLLRDIVYR
ncbi:MAG: TRAP transporter large permease subunit [Pseudolabrys sp.]|nr:TRAP transporter large permease subunit [Pseudolabrys sp.]